MGRVLPVHVLAQVARSLDMVCDLRRVVHRRQPRVTLHPGRVHPDTHGEVGRWDVGQRVVYSQVRSLRLRVHPIEQAGDVRRAGAHTHRCDRSVHRHAEMSEVYVTCTTPSISTSNIQHASLGTATVRSPSDVLTVTTPAVMFLIVIA